MATFPAIAPDFSAEKTTESKTRRVAFGDGYEQRITFGLNQNPRTWQLTWDNRSEADCDTIETFLNARVVDGASFDWTPPDEATSYKWVCESNWTKRLNSCNFNTITATFRQVFEP
jgi:phage-related protein